jgi:hypothetical protein
MYLFKSFFKIVLGLLMVFNYVENQAQTQCGVHSDEEYGTIYKQAQDAELSGNYDLHDQLMESVKTLVMDDIMAVVSLTDFPPTNGLYCQPNPLTDYAACCLKLAARAEMMGVGNQYPEVAMRRAEEAVDIWTTEFAQTSPPAGEEKCKKYVECLFKAMAQRELIALEHSATDDKLKANLDKILEEGCDDPCNTLWMAFAKVNISWQTDDDTVTMSGMATWDKIGIIVNLPDLEENCMMFDYDSRITFPRACDGGVINGSSIEADVLQLIDGDSTFAEYMVEDTDLVLCATETLYAADLRMSCYMGFSEHGATFSIPLNDHKDAIKKRKPFSVSTSESNNYQDVIQELPSYRTSFSIHFYPIWDK